jgi:hypothetical protein
MMVCRNLMITMLLGGLWHGAAWTFIIWGGLHGMALCLERVWREVRPGAWPAVPRVIGLILTFHLVCLAWIFFRAASFEDALAFLRGVGASGGPPTIVTPLEVALIATGLGVQAAPPRLLEGLAARLRALPAPVLGAGLAASVLVVDALRPEGVAPFIYFQF